MDLEKIEELRKGIKNLKDSREINVKEALDSLTGFKKRYDALIEEKGIEYCTENCSDIIIDINNLTQEFVKYHVK
jgi:hypothetical protein